MSVSLKIKRQNPADDLELPSYQTPGAAGMDVRASENHLLQPGETALVATGFCLEIPEGWEVQLRPRSGLALKHGITLLNSPGTVDADFRGEVKILLSNFGPTAFQVERGERIAQMVVARVERVEFEVVTEIADSQRGEAGFGHTGRA